MKTVHIMNIHELIHGIFIHISMHLMGVIENCI